MKNENFKELADLQFKEFDYQLIYMRVNPHSNECLTVGLAAESEDRMGIELKMISSVKALDLLANVIGDDGVEQFQFAAGELRRSVTSGLRLHDLRMPTNLLEIGERTSAFTQDRTGLLTNVLSTGSVLNQTASVRGREVVSNTTSRRVSRDLYEHVSILNPLKANKIFNRKISVGGIDGHQVVDMPILGENVFGAPVSLAATNNDQKNRAEAYIAKLNWLRHHVTQQPKVYCLAPTDSSSESNKATGYFRELRDVADASKVDIDISESMAELASILIRDEAA